MIMNKSSRRHFLAVTGAGVAAAGATTVLPSAFATAQHSTAQPIDQSDFDTAAGAPLSDTTLMACVTDASAGEITVINGGHEITVSDPSLAQRIAQLSEKEA
jgi:hypothetical protein